MTARMTPTEIDRWMVKYGYSNATLGEALGYPRGTVVRWRSGLQSPPAMLRLALMTLQRRKRPARRVGGHPRRAGRAAARA